MRDVQNESSKVKLKLETVGISDMHFPLKLLDKKRKKQHTTGIFSMYADLDAEHRGTHMSRFVEILNTEMSTTDLNSTKWTLFLKKLKKRLSCKKITLEVSAPYFIEKKAPVSLKKSLLKIDVKFILTLFKKESQKILEITVPVTSLCPCSKEISKYGAHNQRSYVTIQIISKDFIWIEDLVEIIESSASCPIYPLLKRPDEKYVTEKAYENPVFVEDIVRNISSILISNKKIKWFCVKCKNLESIHDHNAFAKYEYGEKYA